MKRWLFLLPAILFGCPQFAPDDVCGYPGFCDASLDAGDSGKDGGAQCPSGKEPKDDPSCVTDTSGIFVAPSPTGNDANAGTKASPVATLKAALQKVGAKSFIFICEGAYSESVDIKQSAAIFGGFKCTDWSYSATTLPKFTGTKPDYVFHLDGANNTIIGDLEIDAMDGTPGTGQSSVGMFVVNSQTVKVERLTIHAGKGADGALGTTVDYAFPDAGLLKGNVGTGLVGGAANSYSACAGGGITVGGKGGDNGFSGDAGLPVYGTDGGLGGIVGQPCNNGGGGGDGDHGPIGVDGVGATSLGDVQASGWIPTVGQGGQSGKVGQGGGGGQAIGNGAGGGGAAGGCGGAPGGGGSGGGGSIAIAALNSVIALNMTTCACNNAGIGGAGVPGQVGATGGFGGFPNPPGCAGGNGGTGGNGGGGGGGAGGVSIAVITKGGAVTIDAFTQGHITTGTPGTKGIGAAGNDGIAGIADASLTL